MPDLHKIQLNFTQMQKIINICGVHKKGSAMKNKPVTVIKCKKKN